MASRPGARTGARGASPRSADRCTMLTVRTPLIHRGSSRRILARARQAAVVVLIVATALVTGVDPAGACSCGGSAGPTIDFTGVAVEDLGYSDGGGALGLGETRAWLLDVTEARLGIDAKQVRISIVVGEIHHADGSVATGACGMDDNLIIGASYDVTS